MKYRGSVYEDGDPFLTVEGEHGYCSLVTVKVERVGFGCEFYMCPEHARELARHLNEAADVACLPAA